MVDLATLALRIDSREVAQGVDKLDDLTRAGSRAEKAVDRLGDESVQAGRQIKSASAAAADMARDAQVAANRTTAMGNSTRQIAFGMRNLGFQFHDLGVQFAGAANSADPLLGVMMALIQQGPQIKDAMAQAEIGVGGLVKTLGTGIARFGVFAVAAGAGAYQMKQFTDGLNDNAGADKFIQTLGLTADEIKELEKATITFGDVALGTWDVVAAGIWDVIGPAVTTARGWFDDWFSHMNAEGAKLINNLVGFFVGGLNAIGAVWSRLPGAIGDIATSAANMTIAAINQMVQTAVNGINALINAANTLPGVDIGTLTAPQIGAIENSFSGAAEGAWKAFETTFEAGQKDYWGKFSGAVGDAAQKRFEDRMRSQASDLIGDRSGGGARKKALDDEAKAMERAARAAESYLKSLETETARIGKTAIEIKKMEVAANAAAADNAGLGLLAQKIREAGQAWEAATRAQADADFQNNVIKPLQDELALLGLVGPARELAALALEEQAFKAKAAKDGITDVNKAWEEYLRLRKDIIEGESALKREREEAELLNDQLRDMIGILGQLGGVGQGIGALLGIFSGNVSAIGGPIGQLLNQQIEDKDGRVTTIAKVLGGELKDVFGKDSDFGKVISGLTNVLQGAGSGMIAANALFGNQSGAQKIGGALGGALGQVAGQALGKAIGGIATSLGGPLGAIAGGVLGSVIGGLFGSKPPPPSGSGSVSNTGLTSTANNAQIAASLDSFGGAVQSTIMNIADQLGGKVGDYAIGMGRHREWYQVSSNANDPYLGQGYYDKKSSTALYDGVDAEAALRIAIKEIIRQGAIEGVSAGVQTLIGKGEDIERQLAKAIKFEGVFDELKQATDPLGFALDGLANQFDQLRDIFEEAGATAEEYAKLEQLYALRRQEAISAEFRERADMEVEILRLLGREQEALTLARESELTGIKDSLKPLQQMIYTLQDARAIIDQFQPLSDSLKAFKTDLMGNRAQDSFGVLRGQFQTTASAAAGGDAMALARLEGVSTAYLDAARENAASRYDYDRAVGEVLASVDKGIFAADAQIEYAQLQIDAIDANRAAILTLKNDMAVYQQAIAESVAATRKLLERFEGDGLRVKTDADTPVYVATATGFTVQTS